jgi:SNF2 family DNA or RNA helicase
MLKPFVHQTATTNFILKNPRTLITSDPGTGKTRSVIDAFAKRKDGRMLVLAPLSILSASWADDIKRFQPKLTSVVAYARNRETAFRSDADIVITNHDAAKWISKHEFLLDGFSTICIDEFTAFKNKDSQRSKALARIVRKFNNRIAMSGTPNSNTILDIWHPMLLIDDGERLGKKFYGFRGAVCTSRFNGFANEWVDKPNAQDIVSAAIKDVNIRYMLEECIDMPEQSVHTMLVDLTPKIMDQYNILAEDSVLYTGKATINAINAGARVKKLLQLCTGAVYTEDGVSEGIHKERYDLVMDLVAAREHSLVAFNWRHEREHLVKLADELGFEYGVIDGETPAKTRADIVNRMQAGQLKVVFAHPQSAGHGLTMTKATSVIWSSPTYNAEHYQQFNRRIYRAGQTQKTQIIHIAARDTWEPHVYEKLQTKLDRMDVLLQTLTSLTANRT